MCYTFLVIYICLRPGYHCAINNTRRIKALRQMAGKNKGLRLGRADTQYHDTPRTFLAIRIFNFTKPSACSQELSQSSLFTTQRFFCLFSKQLKAYVSGTFFFF